MEEKGLLTAIEVTLTYPFHVLINLVVGIITYPFIVLALLFDPNTP